MSKGTILVIDDDQMLLSMLSKALEREGYIALAVENGKDFITTLQAKAIDLIILDLILPDADGIDLISKARNYTDAPIIIVSGKSEVVDKVLGLSMGAHDYMVKPINFNELLARIKVSLRNIENNQDVLLSSKSNNQPHKLKFGDWILDRHSFKVYNHEDKKLCNLTTAEFMLLNILASSPRKILSREQISAELPTKNGDQSDGRSIDIQISRIRKKLDDGTNNLELIKTIRGAGYTFIHDVEVVE